MVERGEEGTAEERVDGGDSCGGGMGLKELREVARNRSAWRALTTTVDRIRRIDGTR